MLSDEVQAALLARSDWRPKRHGARVNFRCPRHDDREPSAWTGGGAWGCFSCGFEEPITTLAKLLGIVAEGGGYTLERYADAKLFSVERLRSWGVDTAEYEGRAAVRIPYYGLDGTELRARYRSASGKWWEGKNQPIHLYGLWRLVELEEGSTVWVVEGESDCHALWHAGLHAVGVPGATSWKHEWAAFLDGFQVFAWEEPDQGGAQFVKRITESLPAARIVRDVGAKDASDLRIKAGDGFMRALEDAMAVALPAGQDPPPVTFDVLDERRLSALLDQKLRPVEAIPTPFPLWNKHCRDEGGRTGLAMGWHVLGAARTGVGKSVLALNLAACAMRAGHTVCFLSLEMAQPQVETRLMAILSSEPVARLEKGPTFEPDAYARAARRVVEVLRTGGRFVTNREPLHGLDAVVLSIRFNHAVHGARFFVVDYLQLAGNPNDPESITAISHAVRREARELQIVTFGLSQFNRQTSVANEPPSIHGLMGGSELENAADQIVLVDHSKVATGVDCWTSRILLAKNRHGPTGAVPMRFDAKTLQMRELLDDEIPMNLQGDP